MPFLRLVSNRRFGSPRTLYDVCELSLRSWEAKLQKFQTIVMDIRHRIESGEYARGHRLPTTTQLCEHYGVSKITVKRAMDELAALGLVARRRGSGTFVKGMEGTSGLTSAENVLRRTTFLSPDSDLLGSGVRREVHDFMVVMPPTDIAEVLGMDSDELAYYICRTRFVHDRPDRVEHTYIPLKVLPNLRESEVSSSLYRLVEERLGTSVSSMHRAVGASHPSEDEARWLGIELKTPLVSVRQVGYLDDGTPFEMSTCVHAPGFEFFDVATR